MCELSIADSLSCQLLHEMSVCDPTSAIVFDREHSEYQLFFDFLGISRKSEPLLMSDGYKEQEEAI
jgi:hypothetical protein